MNVIQAIGRRKRSIARVYLTRGKGIVKINNKSVEDYFNLIYHRDNIKSPFDIIESDILKYDLNINVHGGGITGQSEAVRLAISRALVLENEENKTLLKSVKFLTRDSRVVERKKPGQKKARKKFQWVKR